MNTQNQLTTTDGPAGSLALDPRSAPSSYAMRAAEKLHPEYSLDWWMTIAHQSLQYQNLFCQACDERERIARIIDEEIKGILPNNRPRNALATLLNTSAVMESTQDDVTLCVTSVAYEAAYEALNSEPNTEDDRRRSP